LTPSSIDPDATILQEPEVPTRTPSEFVGIVVQVGIMLFAVVAATDVLRIPALTAIVSGIVLVAGRVLSGLVVFAIGLYLANLAFSLIASSGTRQARLLGQTARIAIIAFVAALALQQMGIGSDIVNLAFGLLLGAIAVGIALAFGLGGREIAADQIREWLASFKQDKTPRS
ncbi:MAG: mechanosensitive ion channel, partial [Microcoleus sp. T3-bin5]|nr:mechanosensitive ion channel [Microcoleus sp. T3-bin5]